jgi:hypothetical protein
LQRRLEQSRRLAALPSDPLTKERLDALVLEGQMELVRLRDEAKLK